MVGAPGELLGALHVAAGSNLHACVNLLRQDDRCKPPVARGKQDAVRPDEQMQISASIAQREATFKERTNGPRAARCRDFELEACLPGI